MKRNYESMDLMWVDVGRALFSGGAVVDSRAGGTREVLGFCARIQEPHLTRLWNPVRKMSKAYAAAEMLWYLSGTRDASLVKAYAPSYDQFLDDGVNAHGAYGERWARVDQLRDVVAVLRDLENTRQAVISCWYPSDLRAARDRASKDIPCTLTIQLLLRGGELHMLVNMRSNDWWLGMPYDVWCFSRLQCCLAAMVDADPGVYQHQVGSVHVYQRDYECGQEAIETLVRAAPEQHRFAFDCPEEMENMTARALRLEAEMRAGKYNEVAADNLLGRGTFHRDLLERCRARWKNKKSGHSSVT